MSPQVDFNNFNFIDSPVLYFDVASVKLRYKLAEIEIQCGKSERSKQKTS